MRGRTSGRARGLVVRALGAGSAIAAGLALLGPAAGAQDDADTIEGLEIDVFGGVDGIYRPGRPAPIDIQIEADQLLTGELEIVSRVGQQQIIERAEIEVPAGSRKRFVVPMPTPETDRPAITVSLRLDGAEAELRTVTLERDSDVELVGVLPLVTTVAELPESAGLLVDAGTARLFPISAELLGAGFDGLWLFDSLVATNADLDALSSREVDAVLAWTGAGGHLLVDETGGAVPRIPAEWQPSADRAAAAGHGVVRFTDGLAKAGMWDEFLLPTPVDSDLAAGDFDIRRFTGRIPGGLADELSRDAGFDLPPIADLLTLFAIYAVVAGPVSYVILRRRGRTTALWITIPALSILTTIGVWFVGSELRSNTSASHATVVLTSDGVGYATSHVLVGQDAGGISTPRGWIPTGRVGESAYEGDAAALEMRPTAEGYTADVSLDTGQFAIASARGVLDVAGFDIDATSDRDGRVTGTVTNASGVALDHVTVVSGSRAVDLGTLAADATEEFSLDAIDDFDIQIFEWQVWGDAIWNDPTIATGLWNASRQERGGINASPIGTVTAVGWTGDLDAPVTTRDGDTIDAGRTLIVSRDRVGVAGDVISNMTSTASLVRGPGDTGGEQDGSGRLSGVYQFHTAAEFVDGPITVHIPRYAVDVDIWQDSRWRSVQVNAGEERDVELSGEGFALDGLVHVRMTIDSGQIFEFGNGDVLTITQVSS